MVECEIWGIWMKERIKIGLSIKQQKGCTERKKCQKVWGKKDNGMILYRKTDEPRATTEQPRPNI